MLSPVLHSKSLFLLLSLVLSLRRPRTHTLLFTLHAPDPPSFPLNKISPPHPHSDDLLFVSLSYQNDMGNAGTIDGGVRLFKCYISTSTPVGGPGDEFRYYTVQNLFSNLLLESAEDEVSFQTVVRDLKSRKPLLQLVLLNSKAWYFSGTCIENQAMEPNCLVELRPVVKVLFSDCSDASEADIRNAYIVADIRNYANSTRTNAF